MAGILFCILEFYHSQLDVVGRRFRLDVPQFNTTTWVLLLVGGRRSTRNGGDAHAHDG